MFLYQIRCEGKDKSGIFYLGENCELPWISSGTDSKSITPIGSTFPLILSTVKFLAAFPPIIVYLQKVESKYLKPDKKEAKSIF